MPRTAELAAALVVPVLPVGGTEALEARLERARRREQEAVKGLREALRRSDELESRAVELLATYEAMLETARTMLRRGDYL